MIAERMKVSCPAAFHLRAAATIAGVSASSTRADSTARNDAIEAMHLSMRTNPVFIGPTPPTARATAYVRHEVTLRGPGIRPFSVGGEGGTR